MDNTISMIPIGSLYHHPQNPRIDLGDLTELAESIKARGIMQNLTVVPRWRDMTDDEYAAAVQAYRENPTAEGQTLLNRHLVSDGYNVVIGNRRLEAANSPGWNPCPVLWRK